MVSDWLLFLLAALATYRLSRLIADEEGPWSVFSRLRDLTPEQSSWRRGVECIMCVSVWAAVPVALWLVWSGDISWRLAPLVWLALSAVTVLIRKWEQKR